MSDGSRRGSSSERSARTRLLIAGAFGIFGFAVVYFLDPQEGPRRRREAIDALQEAAYEALRLSQQFVDRLAEPVAAEPAWQEPGWRPVPQPRLVTPLPAAPGQETGLAEALHDEVSIFRLEPEPEEVPVGVGVGGPPDERLEAEPPARTGSDRVSYVHSVSAPPTPRPTIISYDPEPREDRVATDVDATTTKPRSGSRRWLMGGAAALILLAAAALGAWAVWDGGDEGTRVAAPRVTSGAAQALQLISQPGTRSVPVGNSKGAMVLVVTPSGRAALIISGLEKAPPGKEYQAWVVTSKGPRSAGLFKGGSTRLVIPLGQKLPKGSIFAVTVEQAGGVPAPTQKPRFAATIA